MAIIASTNHGGSNGTFAHLLHATTLPGAYLLPVMGVLLICGEWSQRTTLTTFTLVPSRWRVIGAKLGASVIVSTIALVVCLLLTFVFASALGHAPGGTGSLSWQVIAQSWLFLAAGMVMGLAFGAAILVSAPAIVGYLLLPVVWDGVVGGISGLDGRRALAGPRRHAQPADAGEPERHAVGARARHIRALDRHPDPDRLVPHRSRRHRLIATAPSRT